MEIRNEECEMRNAEKTQVRPAAPARPAAAESPAQKNGWLHLVGERHDLGTQLRLLQRMQTCFNEGLRDPELLYLGGRYATSLGMKETARRFLAPLAEMLKANGKPTPAYFPVGLLSLRLLGGAEREAVLRDLETLVDGSPRLRDALERIRNPEAPDASDGLAHRFKELQVADIGAPTAQSTLGVAKGVERFFDLAQQATDHYMACNQTQERAGGLAQARAALEQLLLEDGDQPDILRNLIAIAGEQSDIEGYERYWKRYVKVLLWRIMRADNARSAWDDLLWFYLKVAILTDRKLGDSSQKVASWLATPGFLPRWLEAHTALIWLESAIRPQRHDQTRLSVARRKQNRQGRLALMEFWFRVFYPEFYGFLDLGVDCETELPSVRRKKTGGTLPFDPAEKLLTRFIEWSKFQFALNNDHDAHAQTVTALAGFVARLPLDGYWETVRKNYAKDQPAPANCQRALQDAICLPLRFTLHQFLKGEERDWQGAIAYYGDPDMLDKLNPSLCLIVALGYCHVDQESKGLDLLCQVLPNLVDEDMADDSECANLMDGIFQANLARILKEDGVNDKVAAIRKRLATVPVFDDGVAIQRKCLELFEAASKEALNQHQIGNTIERYRKLMDAEDYTGARAVARELPDEAEMLRDIKRKMLEQVDEAIEMETMKKRLDAAIEESKQLVGKGRFDEARKVIRKLPDTPAEIMKLKSKLLEQIDEAQRDAGLNARVEKDIERVKNSISRGKFDEARGVINALPAQLNELKQSLLKQIGDVENDYRKANVENGELINKLIRKNIDLAKLIRLAADNDVNTANALQYNAFLKAILSHLD